MGWPLKGKDVWLVEGPHNGERLPLAAHKHKTLHLADGHEYFRMPMTKHVHPDGTESICYLWSQWKPTPRKRDQDASRPAQEA